MGNRSSENIERTGLIASSVASAIIGIVGVTFALFTESRAIMLDGVFNLTFFVTSLLTLKVASLLGKGDTLHFPLGYAFFEPLVNGFKGVLILGVSLMAFADAVEALFLGGRAINAGLASGYGAFATVACAIVAYLTNRSSKKSNSPLLQTDASNWLVNCAISSAVLLTFLSIFLIRGTQFEYITPYIDPALIIILVLISISIPVRIAWQALMELLNRTPSPEILKNIEIKLGKALESLPIEQLTVRVIQPGRNRMIAGHIVLAKHFRINSITELDNYREIADQVLTADHPNTTID